MAPTPDDDKNHYDAGAPLDGGSSPAILAGDDKNYSPTGLEVGVITGVVVLVILTVVGIFIWRSRKNRAAKNAETASSMSPTTTTEEIIHQPFGTREAYEPLPPPKDDFASTVENDDLSSIERPSARGRTRPSEKWNHWITVRRGKRVGALVNGNLVPDEWWVMLKSNGYQWSHLQSHEFVTFGIISPAYDLA
ncbi:hypothetical protein AAE478_008452 [Parahypoxylon ruwenzoriense]